MDVLVYTIECGIASARYGASTKKSYFRRARRRNTVKL